MCAARLKGRLQRPDDATKPESWLTHDPEWIPLTYNVIVFGAPRIIHSREHSRMSFIKMSMQFICVWIALYKVRSFKFSIYTRNPCIILDWYQSSWSSSTTTSFLNTYQLLRIYTGSPEPTQTNFLIKLLWSSICSVCKYFVYFELPIT